MPVWVLVAPVSCRLLHVHVLLPVDHMATVGRLHVLFQEHVPSHTSDLTVAAATLRCSTSTRASRTATSNATRAALCAHAPACGPCSHCKLLLSTG